MCDDLGVEPSQTKKGLLAFRSSAACLQCRALLHIVGRFCATMFQVCHSFDSGKQTEPPVQRRSAWRWQNLAGVIGHPHVVHQRAARCCSQKQMMSEVQQELR